MLPCLSVQSANDGVQVKESSNRKKTKKRNSMIQTVSSNKRNKGNKKIKKKKKEPNQSVYIWYDVNVSYQSNGFPRKIDETSCRTGPLLQQRSAAAAEAVSGQSVKILKPTSTSMDGRTGQTSEQKTNVQGCVCMYSSSSRKKPSQRRAQNKNYLFLLHKSRGILVYWGSVGR